LGNDLSKRPSELEFARVDDIENSGPEPASRWNLFDITEEKLSGLSESICLIEKKSGRRSLVKKLRDNITTFKKALNDLVSNYHTSLCCKVTGIARRNNSNEIAFLDLIEPNKLFAV
jgi:hypothetical protein